MFKGELSQLQADYINNATKRWNFKSGATRSGKTYLDTVFIIPYRLRTLHDLEGLIYFIGTSRNNLERNVFKPMRDMFGENLVGQIKKESGTIRLFGEECFVFSAEKKDAVKRIRGSSVKYLYGDEMTDWVQDVFDILKSRLDKPYSICDATFNPQGKGHWLYKFIEKNPDDLYYQKYTLFDNPFNDPVVVRNMCNDYAGSVLYNRYILGDWCNAEGAVYELYNNDPTAFDLTKLPRLQQLSMGVDFGGNKSATSFVLTGFSPAFKKVIILKSKRLANKILSPTELEAAFTQFVQEAWSEYKRPFPCHADSAETTLIKGLKQAAMKNALPVQVKNALKGEITQRIRLINRLMGSGRFGLYRGNDTVKNALLGALYDEKSFYDKRLDDGTSDIDTLDAMEYSIEPFARYLFND
jgi:PBSX family phage terminase large subunit